MTDRENLEGQIAVVTGAYDDLGTEAIRRLEIEDLPAIVVIDSEGNNLYETAVKEYAEE